MSSLFPTHSAHRPCPPSAQILLPTILRLVRLSMHARRTPLLPTESPWWLRIGSVALFHLPFYDISRFHRFRPKTSRLSGYDTNGILNISRCGTLILGREESRIPRTRSGESEKPNGCVEDEELTLDEAPTTAAEKSSARYDGFPLK